MKRIILMFILLLATITPALAENCKNCNIDFSFLWKIPATLLAIAITWGLLLFHLLNSSRTSQKKNAIGAIFGSFFGEVMGVMALFTHSDLSTELSVIIVAACAFLGSLVGYASSSVKDGDTNEDEIKNTPDNELAQDAPNNSVEDRVDKS